MRSRELAALMIHRWAEAAWPVKCIVRGIVIPFFHRVRGILAVRDEVVLILGEDDSMSLLPPELLSADRIEASISRAGVTRLRFRFPYVEITLTDRDRGGSYAIH